MRHTEGEPDGVCRRFNRLVTAHLVRGMRLQRLCLFACSCSGADPGTSRCLYDSQKQTIVLSRYDDESGYRLYLDRTVDNKQILLTADEALLGVAGVGGCVAGVRAFFPAVFFSRLRAGVEWLRVCSIKTHDKQHTDRVRQGMMKDEVAKRCLRSGKRSLTQSKLECCRIVVARALSIGKAGVISSADMQYA
jgi:hypothetical protein